MKKILSILAVTVGCLSATPALASYVFTHSHYVEWRNVTVCHYQNTYINAWNFSPETWRYVYGGNKPERCPRRVRFM